MGNYSIKQLEKLSGVKSHTIRIWEQRYGLLKPKRTDTNIRYYDDDQLKRLLNISMLNNNGHKISKISDLSKSQMRSALKEILEVNGHVNYEEKINGLIVAMLEVNEVLFEEIMTDSIQQLQLENAISKIVYPFLYKVGIMWGMDEVSPPQEHFISNLIRHRIIIEIGKLPKPELDAPRYLLFLPEDELHDVGLLLGNYELRKQGKRVIYLGQNTPLEGIKEISDRCEADALMTFFVKTTPIPVIQDYLKLLSKIFRNKKIIVSGRQDLLSTIEFPENILWIKSPEEL